MNEWMISCYFPFRDIYATHIGEKSILTTVYFVQYAQGLSRNINRTEQIRPGCFSIRHFKFYIFFQTLLKKKIVEVSLVNCNPVLQPDILILNINEHMVDSTLCINSIFVLLIFCYFHVLSFFFWSSDITCKNVNTLIIQKPGVEFPERFKSQLLRCPGFK